MPDINGLDLTEEDMVTLRSAIQSRAVTDPWAKNAIHAALKAGRVEELWPGGAFSYIDAAGSDITDPEVVTDWGRLRFADGSRVKIGPLEGTS